MIAFLRGRLLEKHPNRLIVDVNGVGYDVAVPLSTFLDMTAPGAEVALRVHTHVREDQLALYGFGSALEQQMFERLITISGIGPKLALAVLSGMDAADLVRAIRTADLARLHGIPGIGKKTAERIVVELRDKLPAGPASAEPGAPATPPAAAEVRADVLSALVNLGYQRAAADKALDRAVAAGGAVLDIEGLLRAALRHLGR
jgi:Holliday junction DNA helicase RuvA